mmetsp:Transcript_18191/g.36890  ORF Transcript_18191/g.36890 Transcript_18191/m.36890 type:complete len:118 (+) Transcript_18191:578-931(+)
MRIFFLSSSRSALRQDRRETGVRKEQERVNKTQQTDGHPAHRLLSSLPDRDRQYQAEGQRREHNKQGKFTHGQGIQNSVQPLEGVRESRKGMSDDQPHRRRDKTWRREGMEGQMRGI